MMMSERVKGVDSSVFFVCYCEWMNEGTATTTPALNNALFAVDCCGPAVMSDADAYRVAAQSQCNNIGNCEYECPCSSYYIEL